MIWMSISDPILNSKERKHSEDLEGSNRNIPRVTALIITLYPTERGRGGGKAKQNREKKL